VFAGLCIFNQEELYPAEGGEQASEEGVLT
jgi:hypothetical protein